MHFLISTLAEYQTVFWRDVGVMLRDRGHGVSFLSFDDRSTAMLRAVDLEVFTIADCTRSRYEGEIQILFGLAFFEDGRDAEDDLGRIGLGCEESSDLRSCNFQRCDARSRLLRLPVEVFLACEDQSARLFLVRATRAANDIRGH